MSTRDLSRLQTTIWKTIDRIEDVYTRELFVNYKIALDEIRVELSKVYEKYAIKGKLTHAEMSRFNRLDKLHTQLSDILGPTLSRNGRLVEDLRTVQYQESFYRHGWAIDQSSNVSLRWGLLNEATVKAAVENDLLKIAKKGMAQDGLLGIRRTVTQGLIQGQSYPKMARGIKDFLERSASGYMRIVRTEGQRAAVLGQLDNYDRADELGVKIHRVWDAALDKATRPEHGQLDGQVADESGMFQTAVGPQPGPMHSGVPSFDINCRCRVRAQVVGYEPKVRRIRDEGIQPYQTYTDWAKERGITVNKYGRKLKGITPTRKYRLGTRADATKWAKTNIKGLQKVEYGKANLRDINYVFDAIEKEIKIDNNFDMRNIRFIQDPKRSAWSSFDILGHVGAKRPKTLTINTATFPEKAGRYSLESCIKNKPDYIRNTVDFSNNLKDGVENLVTHEIGHARMYSNVEKARHFNIIEGEFAKAKTAKNFISDYASVDADEFFAELYTARRMKLTKIPEWFDELMGEIGL